MIEECFGERESKSGSADPKRPLASNMTSAIAQRLVRQPHVVKPNRSVDCNLGSVDMQATVWRDSFGLVPGGLEPQPPLRGSSIPLFASREPPPGLKS